jgi:DNA polymerase-3 subunit delta'
VWQVLGQERVVRQVERALREGRLAHAYLITGPPHTGKMTLAKNIAQAVNCLTLGDGPCGECSQCQRIAQEKHPDVCFIGLDRPLSPKEMERQEKEKGPRKGIGIDDIRELSRLAGIKPFEGRYRVFILDGAEYLSDEASNCLLKTLEEPPPQVLILLLASEADRLLPTILSRCQRLDLRPLPLEREVEALVRGFSLGEEEAERLARLSRGCLGWAIGALQDPQVMEKRGEELERLIGLAYGSLEERFNFASELADLFSRDRETAKAVLYLWLGWWRDILLVKEGAERFVQNLDRLDTLRMEGERYTRGQAIDFVKAVLETLYALDDNANARLALELLMLNLPGGEKGR